LFFAGVGIHSPNANRDEKADTINLMVSRFINLLKSAVSNMQQPVSSLSMLGEEETGGVTVEDFPDIGLDQQDLENLILELSE